VQTFKNQHPAKQWVSDLILLTLFLGIFYALWIGSHALFTPDEGRYSEVAREMIVTGDYVTPRLNGVVFLDKPIMYYWLQASAMLMFGIKEWALRFWPALAGVLGCLMTYVAGRMLFNRRSGIIASIVLASSPLYYGAAHYANLDLEVAVFISISLMSFIVAIQSASKHIRDIFLITAYVFAGIAALTKGLIGIAFPGMIIGIWIILSGRWDTFKKMHLFLGLSLFTAIALPWYILVQKANPEFFQFFFVKQQVSRFLTTEAFNNRTPGWFYVPIVLGGLFPWCIFVIQAVAQNLKLAWKDRKNHSTELYLLIWLILIFTFFSFPKSKTVGYILPIFPALALLIGSYLSTCWDKMTKGVFRGLLAFLALGIGGAIVCLTIPHTPYHPALGMTPYLTFSAALLLIASSALIFLLLTKPRTSYAFIAVSLTAVAFLLTVAASSGVINEKTIKPLAVQIKPIMQPNDEIVAFYKYFQDLPIYLEKRITIVADWNAKDIPLKDNWVRELWYGMPFQDTKEWLIGEDLFWKRWNGENRLFVFTNEHYYNAIQKKSKKPVYKIAEFNQAIVISNRPS
jgi:4-amino-4-deoxy-L-arabinose transferase-like glycosyltransferase